jgi:hypothetical protein
MMLVPIILLVHNYLRFIMFLILFVYQLYIFYMSQNQSFSNKNILQTWSFLGHPKIKIEAHVKTTLTFGLMSFLRNFNKFTSFSYSMHLFLPLLWNIPIWSTSFACSTPKSIYLCQPIKVGLLMVFAILHSSNFF